MGAQDGDDTGSIIIPAVFISRTDFLELSSLLQNGAVNATLNEMGQGKQVLVSDHESVRALGL